MIFLGWNEDCLNSYHLIFYSNKSFYYGIKVTDSQGVENKRAYLGKFRFGNDSLYLRFSGRHKPPDLQPYLVFEASGKFLIQTFKNSNDRYFLRLTYNRHR